jgi:hypothetical protein
MGVEQPLPGKVSFQARFSGSDKFAGYGPLAVDPESWGPLHAGQFSAWAKMVRKVKIVGIAV